MVMLRPARGGFIRAFGCGIFIRDFLLGKGTQYGAMSIDPEKGACQADIFYHYKLALHKSYAEDAVAREQDERAKKGLVLFTELEYAERVGWYLKSIPYKLVKSRYHSFRRYFHYLKQLEWVELTGAEEISILQEVTGYHHYAHPRRLYRLTSKGIMARDEHWSNPQRLIYAMIGDEDIVDYVREMRKLHKYRRPGKYDRYLRPFTVGQFIRDYLMGLGPEGSTKIDPDEGDFTERIFYHYKEALRRAYAKDAVERENDSRIQKKREPFTPEEYAERIQWHLDRIPYKLHRARSISFFKYFYFVKRLGFVEATGREDESYIQGINYPGAPPCRYYRLSEKGKTAPEHHWYRPQLTLYPEINKQYFAQKNVERKQQS